jgi:hypothetical protein
MMKRLTGDRVSGAESRQSTLELFPEGAKRPGQLTMPAAGWAKFQRFFSVREDADLLAADSHVGGLQAFRSAFQLKLNRLPFLESFEVKLMQPATMEKDLVAIRANKPEPPLTHQLLDRPFHVHLARQY